MTREDYIKNLQSMIDGAEDMGLYDEDVESLQEAIKALEPKTGNWIRQKSSYGSTYICSACNRDIYLIGYPAQDFKEHNYDFCPNCGAKMVESEESD